MVCHDVGLQLGRLEWIDGMREDPRHVSCAFTTRDKRHKVIVAPRKLTDPDPVGGVLLRRVCRRHVVYLRWIGSSELKQVLALALALVVFVGMDGCLELRQVGGWRLWSLYPDHML